MATCRISRGSYESTREYFFNERIMVRCKIECFFRRNEQMGRSPLDAIEASIRDNPELGDSTKSHYLIQFGILVQLAGGSATTVFRSPEKVYEAMRERYSQTLTRKSLMSVARAIAGHLPEIGNKFPSAAEKYSSFIKKDDDESGTSERMLNGKLSEREEHVYLPWEKVVEARNKMETDKGPGAPETMLVSMYVLMEPLRQDYGNVVIIGNETGVPSLGATQNYLILPDSETSEVTLVLRTYKTAKKYGEFKRLIPSPLVKIIRASLKEHPRDHMFVDSRNRPFLKRNSFIKWSNRCLEVAFEGRRVTVNTLRHSYISSLDFNTRTPGELMRTSKMMGHSLNMQQMYRRLPDREMSGESHGGAGETIHASPSAHGAPSTAKGIPTPHGAHDIPKPKPTIKPVNEQARRKNIGGIVVIQPKRAHVPHGTAAHVRENTSQNNNSWGGKPGDGRDLTIRI